MKRLLAYAFTSVLLAPIFAPASVQAQTPAAAPATPVAPSAPSAAASSAGLQRRVIAVDRLPASVVAAPKSRASTAAIGGAREKTSPRKLPDLTVLDRDRKSIALSSLAHKDHWLLLLRTATCIPCDRLMNKLVSGGDSALQNGTPLLVVVLPSGPDNSAAAASDGVERVRGSYSTLSSATWVADPQRSALLALKATGTPMLYGMNGTDILWRLAGGLGTDADTTELVHHWLTTTTPAQPRHTTGESPAKAADPTTTTATGSVSTAPQPPSTSAPKP